VEQSPPEKGYIKDKKRSLQEKTYKGPNQRLGRRTTTEAS
jgi:hypothetical protein